MVLLLELFSGTGSVGKVAARMGWRVVSVDADARFRPTHAMDVRAFPYKQYRPDVVWASPPCTTYSLAATWVRHRDPQTARAFSPAAKEADALLRHTLKMIRYWQNANPKLVFCIENPRGYMRKMPELQSLLRTTTAYGQYGWPIAKPTDFWTNFPLTLRPAGSTPSIIGRVGTDPGWRKRLAEALGEGTQAAVLGKIPPKLVRSILTQAQQAQGAARASPRKQRSSR